MLENQKIQWCYASYGGEYFPNEQAIVINSLVNICHDKTMQHPNRSGMWHDEQEVNVVLVLVTIDQSHESMPSCKVHSATLVLHEHFTKKKRDVLQLSVLKNFT